MISRFYIVDDDPAVRRMLSSILSDLGNVVGESSTAKDALSVLANCQVDVVLVDLLMPDMDGIELVRRLKPVCSAAFVMISQVQAKEMVGEAYRAGVEFFINKPINSIEVRSVLERVCEVQRLKSAVSHIYKSVSEVTGSSVQRVDTPEYQVQQIVRTTLYEVGIGGEAGAKDLEEGACYLLDSDQSNSFSLKDLLMHVAGKELSAQKAAEQRMRRAAQNSLRHLAALGLEDYGNAKFESLAGTFFDFAEVRTEMRFLEGLSPHGGKISLKRFLSALAHQAVKAR